MKLRLNRGMIWAALAALAVLLIAWFVQLPPIIAGEEALAAKTIPTDRASTRAAAERFYTSSTQYQNYIQTHDLGALLITARQAVTQAKSAPEDAGKVATVRAEAAQVVEYAGVLQSYAQASDG